MGGMKDAIDAILCWAVGAIFSAATMYCLFTGRIKFNKPLIERRSQPWLYWLQIAAFCLAALAMIGMAIDYTILALH
jgi:hypothetical protein